MRAKGASTSERGARGASTRTSMHTPPFHSPSVPVYLQSDERCGGQGRGHSAPPKSCLSGPPTPPPRPPQSARRGGTPPQLGLQPHHQVGLLSTRDRGEGTGRQGTASRRQVMPGLFEGERSMREKEAVPGALQPAHTRAPRALAALGPSPPPSPLPLSPPLPSLLSPEPFPPTPSLLPLPPALSHTHLQTAP